MRFGFCKFGIDCSFFHPTPIESDLDITKDVKKLKEYLDNVLDSLKIKESEIKRLEERINMLEKRNQIKTCDICGDKSSSSNSLKAHIKK